MTEHALRGAIETIGHTTRGRFRVPGCPIRLSSALGLAPEAVAALRARGAV